MSIMIFDLECQNHPYFGAVASPRHPDNFVVLIGQAIDNQPFDGEITYREYNSKEEAKNWLQIPDDVTLLVAHNAPFEMDWALFQQRPEIMRFLARGGRIFCTAYAEYLLSNQQETYPSLDETAPKYGGSHKVDGVKILWDQGVLTADIDRELLTRYLIGPEGDVENTRKIFYGQHAALVARGMWDMALVRMEGMLANCFCMDSGLFIDRTLAYAQLDEKNKKLAELVEGFRKYRTDIPDYVEFKDSSDFHVSAWLFGGPIRYRIRDTWFEDDGVTPKHEKADCWKFGEQYVVVPEGGFTAEQFAENVRVYGNVERYKSGKNKGEPKTSRQELSTYKQKWYDRLHQCRGIIPLDLLPKEILKDFKKEFASKRLLADETPVYSTGKDCIEMLSKRQEFPDEVKALLYSMLEYAKLDKDVGTYYLREQRDEEGNVIKQSGMLQYLTPADIVYHILNCTSTVTTRLSSNRPNLQNIPRGDTSDVKGIFKSRYDSPVWLSWAASIGVIPQSLFALCMSNIEQGIPNGAIIEADYTSLEIVTLAAFSKDEALVRALLDGTDMHCLRLSKKLKEPYEQVLLKCKDDSHPEHKAYKTLRTNIKPPSFAYQYGATAAGIAFATGGTVEEAEEFIANEKALFPGVESFYDDVITPFVEAHTVVCREQGEDGSWHLYRRGVWVSPGGTTYEFRQVNKTRWVNGQKVEGYEFKPTQIRNYPIQGESGYFVQGIAGLIIRWLIKENFFDGRVFLINQVHDALYFDCHLSVIKEVCSAVKSIMQYLPQYFNTLGYDLQVPFPCEVEYGPSMLEKETFHE